MSYDVVVDPGVSDDLRNLAADQADIPLDWRLSPSEVEQAIDMAIRLIDSLREDPRQGEIMGGRPRARILHGARRLKFDPREPPPKDQQGRPRPRMRLVWLNEPNEASVERVRVLSARHRFAATPYRQAAARLGAVRRRRPRPPT